jgi:hypothetical protein
VFELNQNSLPVKATYARTRMLEADLANKQILIAPSYMSISILGANLIWKLIHLPAIDCEDWKTQKKPFQTRDSGLKV